jgi:hypothetical protein
MMTKTGRKNTDEMVRQRRDVVEALLVKGDWTLRRQSQVADQFDVSTRQVRKDAALIRQQWAEQDQEQTTEEIRSDWRQRVQATINQAMELGHTTTVARLLATEARVLGLEAPQQVQIQAQVHTIDDAPRLAAELLKALPAACDVLGVIAPSLPMIQQEESE